MIPVLCGVVVVQAAAVAPLLVCNKQAADEACGGRRNCVALGKGERRSRPAASAAPRRAKPGILRICWQLPPAASQRPSLRRTPQATAHDGLMGSSTHRICLAKIA